MLSALNRFAGHWHFDHLLNDLDMRYLNDFFDCGNMRHVNLLYHRYIDDLFYCLDHWHIDMLVCDGNHRHMPMLVHRDVDMVVHIFDLGYLDGPLHLLYHWHMLV